MNDSGDDHRGIPPLPLAIITILLSLLFVALVLGRLVVLNIGVD